MIIEKHENSLFIDKPFPIPVTEHTLFFDIETTGFSPKTSHLYMIGCGYIKDQHFFTIQWFDETKTNEGEFSILKAFSEFIKNFDACISYNGATFDFTYIQKKFETYELQNLLSGLDHIDIYKKIKPYKHVLALPDLKQKSIEAFLGICRDDKFSGGELISVYDKYVTSNNSLMYAQLMAHNYDDLCGMIKLLPIMSYCQIFAGDFIIETAHIQNDELHIQCRLMHFIEMPVSYATDFFKLFISEYTMTLKINGRSDTLKYFYPNPKDYFYLPLEDTAIHKSIASFVDKEYRQKATKLNCYTKKSSFFLPQVKSLFSPEYKESASSKNQYFTWDTIENNPHDIKQYVQSLLNQL